MPIDPDIPIIQVQQTNYMPWVVAGVLAFLLWQKQDPKPAPVPPGPPVPVVNVESIIGGIFPSQSKGYKTMFFEAADKVQSKDLATEESLFNFLKTEAENVRVASTVDFDKLLNDSIPDGNLSGHEDAVSTFLRRVSAAFGGAK